MGLKEVKIKINGDFYAEINNEGEYDLIRFIADSFMVCNDKFLNKINEDSSFVSNGGLKKKKFDTTSNIIENLFKHSEKFYIIYDKENMTDENKEEFANFMKWFIRKFIEYTNSSNNENKNIPSISILDNKNIRLVSDGTINWSVLKCS